MSFPVLLPMVMPPVPTVSVFTLLPLLPMVTLLVAALVKIRPAIENGAARLFVVRLPADGVVV